jgi:hypothetical protein
LVEKFVQVWGQNPHVRIDWQKVCKISARLAELPEVDSFVLDLGYDNAIAERENSMFMSGKVEVIQVVEMDNHDIHVPSHQKTKDMMMGLGMDTVFMDQHIQEHVQMKQIINGQMNVGAGSQMPTMQDQQDLTANVSSEMMPGAMSGGF